MISFRKIAFLFTAFILLQFKVGAQKSAVDELTNIFKQMATADQTTKQVELANKAEAKLVSYLKNNTQNNLPKLEVPYLGRVESDNGLMVVYTWNVPKEEGGNYYYGVIQYKTVKKKPAKVITLLDATDDINPNRKLKSSNWYGALYYTILNYKVKKSTFYVLLGWDGHNALVNRKIIDVIVVSKKGDISFGAPVFAVGKKYQNRVSFQYSAEVQMMLRYDMSEKMIVFDRLVPLEERYRGFFEYYSPSFTYDGYKIKKKRWRLYQDLDLRNSE